MKIFFSQQKQPEVEDPSHFLVFFYFNSTHTHAHTITRMEKSSVEISSARFVFVFSWAIVEQSFVFSAFT